MYDPIDLTKLMSNTNNLNPKALEAFHRCLYIVKWFEIASYPNHMEDD